LFAPLPAHAFPLAYLAQTPDSARGLRIPTHRRFHSLPSPVPQLPPLPAIRLRVHHDRTSGALASGGFLNVARFELVATYPDGTESAPFQYDVANRRALDAAMIVAHFTEAGVPHVYLRSAVRPPCALRASMVGVERAAGGEEAIAASETGADGGLWEIPAGLIEPGEAADEAAARELGEELGFVAEARALRPLGPWMFPVPGMIAERNVYYRIEVDPRTRTAPTEDGSALEREATIVAIPLAEALAHCRSGAIRDAKTELALRRLAEVL
jgi:ADP-ribose pyrophosphatase